MHDLIPLGRQRCALFGASHPSVSAQLLSFWLYFMSPNCDWPGLPVASFHPGKEGSAPPWWAEHFWWSPWLSDDLHLHRTVRDTSQVHPPLGWYGSQLTSTCLPGPAPPFTPRPPASPWEYLTYPTRLLLQRLNKTAPLFTNSSQGKHSFQEARCKNLKESFYQNVSEAEAYLESVWILKYQFKQKLQWDLFFFPVTERSGEHSL